MFVEGNGLISGRYSVFEHVLEVGYKLSFLNANEGNGENPAGGAPVANLNSVSKDSENVST